MQVNATTPLSRIEVTCDAAGLTSRAGTALLCGLADRLGLTDGLTRALRVHTRSVRHEPGRIVRDLAVMLADGGDCLSDLGVLRGQPVLFGEVASGATAYRCLERLDEEALAAVRAARAAARARAWEQAGDRGRLILDLDATLITAHPEKEGAAGTYKGGFGFHPLLCFEAGTGEALAGILRPGNAGSNTAADHMLVLERALAQLPAGSARRSTLVRCDSGGATHDFLDAVAAQNPPLSRVLSQAGCRRSTPAAASATAPGSPSSSLTSHPGPRAPGRSAAASAPIPARSSASQTQAATASRCCSPTRRAPASRASSRSTGSGLRSRTRSAAARPRGCAACPSAASP